MGGGGGAGRLAPRQWRVARGAGGRRAPGRPARSPPGPAVRPIGGVPPPNPASAARCIDQDPANHNVLVNFRRNLVLCASKDLEHSARIYIYDTAAVGVIPSSPYASRGQPNPQVLTYHHLHPSPAPSALSTAAPTKSSALRRIEKGIVPVFPTGTTGSFASRDEMGST